MSHRNSKGHVEFHQPLAKLVADLPGDEENRQQWNEIRQNDGYPGSCGVIDSEENKEAAVASEALRYENADRIYPDPKQ